MDSFVIKRPNYRHICGSRHRWTVSGLEDGKAGTYYAKQRAKQYPKGVYYHSTTSTIATI